LTKHILTHKKTPVKKITKAASCENACSFHKSSFDCESMFSDYVAISGNNEKNILAKRKTSIVNFVEPKKVQKISQEQEGVNLFSIFEDQTLTDPIQDDIASMLTKEF